MHCRLLLLWPHINTSEHRAWESLACELIIYILCYGAPMASCFSFHLATPSLLMTYTVVPVSTNIFKGRNINPLITPLLILINNSKGH